MCLPISRALNCCSVPYKLVQTVKLTLFRIVLKSIVWSYNWWTIVFSNTLFTFKNWWKSTFDTFLLKSSKVFDFDFFILKLFKFIRSLKWESKSSIDSFLIQRDKFSINIPFIIVTHKGSYSDYSNVFWSCGTLLLVEYLISECQYNFFWNTQVNESKSKVFHTNLHFLPKFVLFLWND